MQIERVDTTPHKDVYHPGDVINIAIYFRTPFVGQCQAGLVPKEHPPTADFERKTFAKANNSLYEGQVYIKEGDIGACVLRATLVPVKGEPQTVAVGDRIFEVRPLTPAQR
jgi:hypothetical protein